MLPTNSKKPLPVNDELVNLALQAAQWMASELDVKGVLPQNDAVDKIEKRFSKQLVRENDNGTRFIDSKVLRKFNKLTKNIAIWENAQKCWRKRTQTDEPGKRRAD